MTVRTRTRLAVVFMLLASFLAAGLSSDAQAKTASSKKKSKHSSSAGKSASSAAIKASGLAAAKATPPGTDEYAAAKALLDAQEGYDRARAFHTQKRDAEAVTELDAAIRNLNLAIVDSKDSRIRHAAGDLLSRCGSLHVASVKARDNALGLPPAPSPNVAATVDSAQNDGADDALAADAPQVEAAEAPELALPNGDADDATLALPAIDDENMIEIEQHPMVDKWLDYFTGRGRPVFERWLTRSGLYMDAMKKTLEREGVPTDLVHLVFVESGFNPHARSYASAVGPWQFIRGTAKIFGLTVNSWVDERKDPEASTVAAARYLKHLYGLFNSWPLALASYNAGERTVINAIQRQGTKDFWSLKLPQQTRDYVPKFMAVLAISRDPARYGFDTVPLEDPLEFDEVTIPGPVDLRAIATASGTDLDEIRRLNPQFLKNAAPAKNDLVTLRVPDGVGEKITHGLEDGSLVLPQIATPADPSVLRHKVRRGESVKSLSLKYGIPAKQIARYNRLGTRGRLRVGRTVLIPMGDTSGSKVSSNAPKAGGESIAKEVEASVDNTKTIKVKRGQTLADIAAAHGTDVATLRELNGMSKKSVLKAGQTLRVPNPS